MTTAPLHPDLIDEIHELILAGHTKAEIADALETTKWQVYKVRRALGITHATNPTSRPVDDVAIHRAINGQRTRLTPAETRQAVHTLTNRGKSIRWIATQLGITTRTVQRHRAALNNQENAA